MALGFPQMGPTDLGNRADLLYRHADRGGRLIRAALTLLVAVTLVFVLLRVSGDPAAILLPVETPPDMRAADQQLWGWTAVWRSSLRFSC